VPDRQCLVHLRRAVRSGDNSGCVWAIPLDIGGDFAGSVSAVMNTCGNIGGAISPALLAYLVRAYGWNVPFVVAAVLCMAAAAALP
jgi:MFS family permease